MIKFGQTVAEKCASKESQLAEHENATQLEQRRVELEAPSKFEPSHAEQIKASERAEQLEVCFTFIFLNIDKM
jgi:hypothetical protein